MSDYKFNIFKDVFEKMLEKGVINGVFVKMGEVPVSVGKLGFMFFGNKLGAEIDSAIPFAVDYYGYVKKTKGLIKQIVEEQKKLKSPYQLRVIKDTNFIHFSAIKIEQIAKLEISLLPGFLMFKKEMLDARGFKHNYSF